MKTYREVDPFFRRQLLEVSGQFNAPAVLPTEKGTGTIE
jgi:hypothetical protein